MSIYDRNYMRNPNHSGRQTEISGRKMLFILIVINVLAMIFLDNEKLMLIIQPGGFKLSQFYQIITAGFLHADIWHLLFNMWGLHLFGSMVAPHINGIKMLILYLSGVICGNLLFVLFNLHPAFQVGLVGASGAVCAVMAAAATLEPDRRLIMIFMPFTPIKTSTMVICYTVMEIFFELAGSSSQIAHLAHLGGFAGGYITMLCCFGRNLPWDPLRSIGKHLNSHSNSGFKRPQPPPRPETPGTAGNSGSRITQQELDYLLDKLSTQGINSLSEYELARLRQARKQMRGEE